MLEIVEQEVTTPTREQMPLVSIVVPAYNHESYVLECLESIRALTYNRLELLLSDDCSPDRTYALASEWAQNNAPRFERVSVVRQGKNLGLVRNLQFLFDAAQGKYLACIASDDLFIDSALESRVAMLQINHNIDAVFGNATLISSTGDVLKEEFIPKRIGLELSSRRLLLSSLLVSFTVPGPVLVLRKESVAANGSLGVLPPDLKGEDRYIYIRLAARGKLIYINEIVSKWRFVKGSLSRPVSGRHDIDLFAQGDNINKHLLSGINRLLIENQILMYSLDQDKIGVLSLTFRRVLSQFVVKLTRLTLRVCTTVFGI